MTICVVGAGLAGTLLAWRLSRSVDVVLVAGETALDATAASGGVVRALEPDVEQRRLAIDSLRELRASSTLRAWADFREIPFAYLGDVDPAVAADVEDAFPGSLSAVQDGVLELSAGVIDPNRLRLRVLEQLHANPRVSVEAVRPDHADVTVLATGAWTPALLPGEPGYRTKAIRYVVARTGTWLPPSFLHEASGLYGAPLRDGLLLGLGTQDWDVAPGPGAMPPGDVDVVVALARERFPSLTVTGIDRAIASADCYCDPPILQLRRVGPRLMTFTGGSGGAAKTALAASTLAAHQLSTLPSPSLIGRTTTS